MPVRVASAPVQRQDAREGRGRCEGVILALSGTYRQCRRKGPTSAKSPSRETGVVEEVAFPSQAQGRDASSANPEARVGGESEKSSCALHLLSYL